MYILIFNKLTLIFTFMSTLVEIIIATLAVSAISLVGAITLYFSKKKLDKIILTLVALSAGALMGGALLHLIPEAVELQGIDSPVWLTILAGFVLFYIIEKLMHWHHCHKGDCHKHTVAEMNLVGEGIHNFLDGLIIAAGFLVSTEVGIAATAAVALHEIPTELGDFGVLIHGGYSKGEALFYNFVMALPAVAGGLAGYFLSEFAASTELFLVPIAAGGFLYVASSDLIPELRKEQSLKKSTIHLAAFLIGVAAMYFLAH
jgi:zinc and cadmium transporter